MDGGGLNARRNTGLSGSSTVHSSLGRLDFCIRNGDGFIANVSCGTSSDSTDEGEEGASRGLDGSGLDW